MCSNCVDYGFLTSHEPAKCPTRAMLHCSHCAVYGHSFETCLKKPDSSDTNSLCDTHETLTVATFIPPIRSKEHEGGVLPFVDDKRVIREYLQARGVKPRAGQLYTQLQEYAKSQSKRPLKIPRPPVEGNAAAKTKPQRKAAVTEGSDEESDGEGDEEGDEEESDEDESSDEEESDEED